ncbi:Putative uncharacterized protein [Lactococcus lactis subsp. lactis A12]|uniref:Uncharacterized protein n=1 Tax=Lactococcus lactis subsp. lactis A12 TaxID=1137134 RepID=S6EZM5_LACLL|nr:Putative uncharacterized protein [Lactococcus lactis subsp. lactis A12]SBW30876.1 Hypothetical protein LLA12_01726 [Lactococcus lactis subsp. lactis]
MNANIVFGT